MANGTLKVSNIQTSSGSGTITIGQSGETIDLSNGTATLNSAMKAVPAFFASLGSSQTVANDTSTKVQIDTELFDSGDFDTSTYRFTPTEAGKYFIFAGVNGSGGGGNSDTLELSLQFYKNGSSVQYLQPKFDNNGIKYFQITGETVADANGTGDYFEIYSHIKSSSSSSSNTFNTFKQQTYFGAFKLIGA